MSSVNIKDIENWERREERKINKRLKRKKTRKANKKKKYKQHQDPDRYKVTVYKCKTTRSIVKFEYLVIATNY